jgi:GH43 family beta-xylosidase
MMKKGYVRWLTVVLLMLLCCKEDVDSKQPPQNLDGKFTNPVLTHAPDPWVIQKDDWYYFTHTTANNLRLYRTHNMSDLKTAESKVVWTPAAPGENSKNIWAPEIHFIQDKWYFYYAADDGANENHRMWALENSSADPFQGTWIDKGEIQLSDDRWAIDGTIFQHEAQLYFLWSGWEGVDNVSQNIYISKMANPWTTEGNRVMLSQPELSWEVKGAPPTINEAPQFLKQGDKVFITYSASGCWTDEYSLGLLSASASSNLLDPASWTKSQQPVFVKNPTALAFGTGHNSFFKSPDGTEDWILYHANASSGEGCDDERSTRMQKFTWKADGTPDFGVPAAVGAALDNPAGEN